MAKQIENSKPNFVVWRVVDKLNHPGGTKTKLAGGAGVYSAHCDAEGKARHFNLML